jgi:integrase
MLRLAGRTERHAALSKRAQETAQALRPRHPRQRHLPHDEAPAEGFRNAVSYSPHSFRVTSITDLLEQNVPREDVQHLAGHADPRTTNLYDRRERKVKKNIG